MRNKKKGYIKNRIKFFFIGSAKYIKNRFKENEVSPSIEDINNKWKEDNENSQNTDKGAM